MPIFWSNVCDVLIRVGSVAYALRSRDFERKRTDYYLWNNIWAKCFGMNKILLNMLLAVLLLFFSEIWLVFCQYFDQLYVMCLFVLVVSHTHCDHVIFSMCEWTDYSLWNNIWAKSYEMNKLVFIVLMVAFFVALCFVSAILCHNFAQIFEYFFGCFCS